MPIESIIKIVFYTFQKSKIIVMSRTSWTVFPRINSFNKRFVGFDSVPVVVYPFDHLFIGFSFVSNPVVVYADIDPFNGRFIGFSLDSEHVVVYAVIDPFNGQFIGFDSVPVAV